MVKKITENNGATLKLKDNQDIAYDFATKVYEKFGKIIKSIIFFGSGAKGTSVKGSDVDLIVILDDCSVQWDAELIAWYREELGKLIQENPYRKPLHINTVRLTTWWQEMLRGEPVILNIIRWGQPLIDFGGFFNPLKVLLSQGKIKSTPETIFVTLQRAPLHMARSKSALLNSVEGLYWAMVDSAHAALIAAKRMPPSPEHVPELLNDVFVVSRWLEPRYVVWYRDLYKLAHEILHGTRSDVSGKEIDEWRSRTDLFVREMARIINRIIDEEKKK